MAAAALAKGGLEEKGGAPRLAPHLRELLAPAEARNPGPG